MQVHNDVYPADPAQLQSLMEKGPSGPIFMVNLLKFKDKAEYEDGRETSLTGREAARRVLRGCASATPSNTRQRTGRRGAT